MSPKKYKLSVIIIAKNEEARIATCLEAVSFADERIVLDNDSIDTTSDIAKEHGATVVRFSSSDFAKLRNTAASKAKGEWVLYVDADEIVTGELAANLQKVIRDWSPGNATGFSLHRKNYYLGTLWPTGEWMLRCFRKDALLRWEGPVHETALIRGRVARIRGDLLHDTHRTLSEMVIKTNEWSETEAALRLAAHHPPIMWWRMLRVMVTAFWDSYIRQGGWRVGTAGIIESIYQGFSMFITYAKLWEMQQGKQ